LPARSLALDKRARFDLAIAGPALLVAVGYYLAARLGFLFTLQPHPISTLWPPNALLMSALLLSAPSRWWVFIAAALPAHLLAELQSGVPLAMVLGWFASNCSEALIGAALVRMFVPGPLRLDSFRASGVFLLFGALAAPLASSFLDAALVRLIGWGEGGYWELVRLRFFSNVMAVLTIVPLVLTWAACGLEPLRKASAARAAEAAAVFAGLLVTSFVIFGMNEVDAAAEPALYYAPLPFLIWAAVRLGPVGTSSSLAMMVFLAIWGAVHGYGPFAAASPQQTARAMQLFLISVSVPLLLLAVVLEERARAERESYEQRLQLTHLSRVAMFGEMSGGLAHELNQPLTAILSNAQAAQHFIAARTIDPQELSEILGDIIAANRHASEVIQRLRAMFRREEARFQALDANQLVREALSLARGDLATRGVEVVPQLAEGLPPIEGDRVQLEQVMLNLIMNAAEAMAAAPGEGRGLTIRTMRLGDGAVQVSFIDRGPGFPPELYEKLFEPFYTTKAQGLGLGLSISRSIVLAHGGRLWGAATPGRGASFHIALPPRP
jgi:signal transduction histidine kinase